MGISKVIGRTKGNNEQTEKTVFRNVPKMNENKMKLLDQRTGKLMTIHKSQHLR